MFASRESGDIFRRVRHSLATLFALATCLTGCWGSAPTTIGPSPIPANVIAAKAQANLFYPDSTIVQRFNRGYAQHDRSQPEAYAGAILSNPASAAEIYAWYDPLLTADGWRGPVSYPKPLATDWLDSKVYRRGNTESFWIAIQDQRSPQFPKQALGTTLFQISYHISPEGLGPGPDVSP